MFKKINAISIHSISGMFDGYGKNTENSGSETLENVSNNIYDG